MQSLLFLWHTSTVYFVWGRRKKEYRYVILFCSFFFFFRIFRNSLDLLHLGQLARLVVFWLHLRELNKPDKLWPSAHKLFLRRLVRKMIAALLDTRYEQRLSELHMLSSFEWRCQMHSSICGNFFLFCLNWVRGLKMSQLKERAEEEPRTPGSLPKI